MSILSLYFPYKTHILATCIPIGCIQLKLFPCDNENLANAVKGEGEGEEEEEEEEEDRRILTLTGKDWP